MQDRLRRIGQKLFSDHLFHASFTNAVLQLLLSGLLMVFIFFYTPQFFNGDTDTARNYLSTVAATLATILALLISVIMVAIQMTASKYTHRVLDFFVRFPFNASLIAFYFVTIFYSIYMLSQIEDHPSNRPPDWIEQGMSADLLLLITCFVALLVYLYFVIQLLKPETIVQGIQREYVLSFRAGDYPTALDKVEQICDIAKKAVSEMDAVTAVSCVENIAELMHLAKMPTDHEDDVLWYHERIVNQLIGIASISFKERETAVSGRILDELHEIGMRYVESGSLRAASRVVEAYALIVRNNLIGQQLLNMIEQAVEQIYSVTCQVLKQQSQQGLQKDAEHFVLQSFQNLGEIGKLVIKNETYGHQFVAKTIIGHAFGHLLSLQISAEGPKRSQLVQQLLYEYMRLAKRLFLQAEIIDIVQITTWLRKETIPYRTEPPRVQTYLSLFLLLTAAALYLRRNDIVVLLVRSVGKYFVPDEEILASLCQKRIEIRHFFDYHEPERYLLDVFGLWQAYHGYALRYPSGPQRMWPRPGFEFLQQPEFLDNREAWRDLFDGLDPQEFFGPGDAH